jgi:hypothetical protein
LNIVTVIAEAGENRFAPIQAAAVLASLDTRQVDSERTPNIRAIWDGIQKAVAMGRLGATPATVVPDVGAQVPPDMMGFMSALFAGQINIWQIDALPINSLRRNPDSLDVYEYDPGQVISVMASISGAKPDVNMVYPPIGPYTTGLIRLFDPRVAADRSSAASIYAPAGGCDLSLRLIQGGVEKIYMLAAPWEPAVDPLSGGSLKTEAINLPAADGPVTLAELLLTKEDVAGRTFYRGKGCEGCNNTGYKGRIGLFELMIMNDEMREMILRNVTTDELRAKAVHYGMITLRDYGKQFEFQGHTTAEEVVRETVHDG